MNLKAEILKAFQSNMDRLVGIREDGRIWPVVDYLTPQGRKASLVLDGGKASQVRAFFKRNSGLKLAV